MEVSRCRIITVLILNDILTFTDVFKFLVNLLTINHITGAFQEINNIFMLQVIP